MLLQILLFLIAAMTDIATRLISNKICLCIAMLGAVRCALTPSSQVIETLLATAFLFLCLSIMYIQKWIGGGDLKLLAALAIGLPPMQLIQALMVMALTGGVLALIHLMLRLLPRPQIPPAGSTLLRRVYAVERWRNVRRAPLPFGVAIAWGGIWTLLTNYGA